MKDVDGKGLRGPDVEQMRTMLALMDALVEQCNDIMELNGHHIALIIGGLNFPAWRHIVHMHSFMVILIGMGVGLGRALVVVEADAGRDHIDQSKTAMRNDRLDQ